MRPSGCRASGLGRILRNRLRPLFEPGAADRPLAGLSVVFTAHNGILLKTMALEGRGVGWLPMTLVAEELRCGSLVDAGNGQFRVPIEIRLYRQHATMTQVAESVWRLVSGE